MANPHTIRVIAEALEQLTLQQILTEADYYRIEKRIQTLEEIVDLLLMERADPFPN